MPSTDSEMLLSRQDTQENRGARQATVDERSVTYNSLTDRTERVLSVPETTTVTETTVSAGQQSQTNTENAVLQVTFRLRVRPLVSMGAQG